MRIRFAALSAILVLVSSSAWAQAAAALSQLQDAAGADTPAAPAPAAPPAAAVDPAGKTVGPLKFNYKNEGIDRVEGIHDAQGKPLDRRFHVGESAIRDGMALTYMASGFNEEFDMISAEDCAAAGGTPVATPSVDARETPEMEVDTFFNPLVWAWRASLERYYRCEDASGRLIPKR